MYRVRLSSAPLLFRARGLRSLACKCATTGCLSARSRQQRSQRVYTFTADWPLSPLPTTIRPVLNSFSTWKIESISRKELVQEYQWVSLKKSFQSFNSRFKRCDTIRNRSINLSRGQDFGTVTRHSSRVQPIFRGSTSFPYTLDHALLPLRLCKARGGGWG